MVGLCGTDAEIVGAEYGRAPPGEDYLILGHENLGRVLAAPAGAEVAVGDLVVGIVRRPDPEPCAACAAREFQRETWWFNAVRTTQAEADECRLTGPGAGERLGDGFSAAARSVPLATTARRHGSLAAW